MNIGKVQKDLKKHFYELGLLNSLSISKATKISQSTVYRNLYNRQVKITKGLRELCNYSKIDISEYQKKDPKENGYLMEVLSTVWNGTDAHAKQLGKLLLAAHSCKLHP